MILYTVPEAIRWGLLLLTIIMYLSRLALSLIPRDYNNNYSLFILYKVKVSFQKVKSHGITNDSTVIV